jgi:hypothetical protein
MSVRYGGKQVAPRDTELNQMCVGDYTAVLWRNPLNSDEWSRLPVDGWVSTNYRLFAGDTLRHIANEEDPPPHYNLTAPKYDKVKQVYDIKNKVMKQVNVEGYVGKPIGKSQAVWLRGLWVDGMSDKGTLGVEERPEEDDDVPEDPYDFAVTIPGRSTENWKERMELAISTKSLTKVQF